MIKDFDYDYDLIKLKKLYKCTYLKKKPSNLLWFKKLTEKGKLRKGRELLVE